MQTRRMIIPALVALVLASPAMAQKQGTVEIGGFGQFTHMDTPWALKNGFGIGARLGVFVTPRWELEADFATSNLTVQPPRIGTGTKQYQTYAGRVTYNLPWAGNDVLVGVGFGGETVDGGRDFSLTPGLGYRWNLNNTVSLRFDGLVEYVENPADRRFDFPKQAGTNSNAARSSNVELRAGLSFLLGNDHEAAPAAAPVAAPVVINQDSIDAARRRDSIDAANAARERARQDSINAAMRARQDSIDAANRARTAESAALRAALETKIYFDYDKSDLRDDAKQQLDAKLPIMLANPNVRIRVEGNADERGSDEYNQALGMRRAEQARRYLVSKGVDAGRIDIVSNGEEKPVCTDHDESCWSQNRRDEFVVVAGGDNLMPAR
ncbi:MAG TPA: peptidoglycan-associated lipoprotein Pal [Gemmatimonadaceae bacterium]|nr:peptidoglycan-associated lipoprotein Pal [Gemmatimonadaceae bacterium]